MWPIKTEVSCPAIKQPQRDTKYLNQSKVQVYHYTHLASAQRHLCLASCHMPTKTDISQEETGIQVSLNQCQTSDWRTSNVQYKFKQAVSHHNITITSLCTHSYETRSLSVRRSAHLLILSEVSLGVTQLQGKVKRSRPRPFSAVTKGFNKGCR
jgi:hypothetical protein